MEVHVRAYRSADLPEMVRIWNEIVDEGIAFPQEERLTAQTGAAFFAGQTRCAVAEAEGRVAAGQIAPYPPGIPVAAPGERLTKKTVAYLAGIGYNMLEDAEVVRIGGVCPGPTLPQEG